jgi:GT2 family glycosyltransferase
VSPDWGPIKVSVLDTEKLPDGVAEDPRFQAIWALIRDGGRPRGMLKIPLDHGRVSSEVLRAEIAVIPALRSCRPPSLPPGVTPPRISVVVCSLLERRDELRRCLDSLAALEYPDFEVIVVDNRAEGAEPVELTGVTVVRQTRSCLSAAKNRGIEEATGEIVAFTDDDVVVESNWLTAIAARLHAHPDEAGVMGLVIPTELETPAQVTLEKYYGGFGPRIFEPVSHRLRQDWNSLGAFSAPLIDAVSDDGSLVRTFTLYAAGSLGPGANMAFRTHVLRDIGGFDTAIGPGTPTQSGEDLRLFMRLAQRGLALGFEPASVVRHTHRRDEEGLRKQITAYGIGWSALLAAAVVDDPRHISHMLGTVPRGGRLLAAGLVKRFGAGRGARARQVDAEPDQVEQTLIRELRRLERRGKMVGAMLYLRSRLRTSQ